MTEATSRPAPLNFYWLGPFGMKVPIDIESVPAEDGENTLFKNGQKTKMLFDALTKEQYLAKFAFDHGERDGYWYKVPDKDWDKVARSAGAICGTVYDPNAPKNPNCGPDGFY
jgi:hypothetical protein